jgi:hypothetical protein
MPTPETLDPMPNAVNRLDRGEIRQPTRTPEGYLKLDAYATRVGVFAYMDGKGKVRRELRRPEHVFNPDSLATLTEKPVTDQHPATGLIDASNAAKYARGWTGTTVNQDGEYVVTPVTILDAGLIGDIDRGIKREVSCGYSCVLVPEHGVWNGETYDAVQTNIRYNHLAVVPKGRAGSEVRLRMDASEQIDPATSGMEEHTMTKIKIDGAEFEASEALAGAFVALQRHDAKSKKDLEEEMDALKKEIDTKQDAFIKMKAEWESVTAKHDKAEAKADALQEQVDARLDSANVQALVRSRVALEKVAGPLLGETVNLDALDDQAVKVAVIKAVSPEAKLDGKSADYIDARYDSAIELAATRTDSSGALLVATTVQKADAIVGSAAEAKARLRTDSAEGWKQPLTAQKKGRN